jgi:hypothetical protein
MKTKSIIAVASASVMAMALALPAYAATTSIDDSALDSIAGKANTFTAGGTSSVQSMGNSTNGSIQVGFYQWDDSHAADASDHKGGNDVSGATSQVQQNVASGVNILGWGAAAQTMTVNSGSIGADQHSESWGTLYVGGF